MSKEHITRLWVAFWALSILSSVSPFKWASATYMVLSIVCWVMAVSIEEKE